MTITEVQVRSILTRAGGYLAPVASHSLQPYRGCALGKSLCGVACYVQHNPWITRGRRWGEFVEVRTNAADAYRAEYASERRWARKNFGRFAIFLASSTEPFQPAERKYRVTRSVLEAMVDLPPDKLIVQTHSPRVIDAIDVLAQLRERCDLHVHLSIETDRETLAGLPNPASTIASRIAAGAGLRERGIFTVATLSPLLPIEHPDRFFARLVESFDAVVLDHFIGGDGSAGGSRTRKTALPIVMEQLHPASVSAAYRHEMAEVARRHFDRVGVGNAGFAGDYLPALARIGV
jgi:DNA repair photolyase